MQAVTNASQHVTTYTYDYDQGFNSLKITEPRGRYVESYQLDIQDRVTSVTNIEGQVMSIDYGDGDFVKSITRFDRSQIENEYDQAGRLTDSHYSRASVPLASVSRTYWPDSQLKSISDASSSVSNTYDRLNRLTNVVTTIGNLSFFKTHPFRFLDASERLLTLLLLLCVHCIEKKVQSRLTIVNLDWLRVR